MSVTLLGDAAYATSHTAAGACTQRLAAGRGHGYRLAAPSLQSECGTVNDDHSTQRDEPLYGSSGEAPSNYKLHNHSFHYDLRTHFSLHPL